MKKFLSLVLALVMTFSLVTISASAKDFTDDESITYDEAVAVISAIGVVDGYTDGSFKPTDTLTRGAAAKIICNLILGPTTAAALSADTAPYSDVSTSHTFAGYIAYCQKAGIISGYSDGTFRPGNTLTSYAFMKMLLGALGYDANVEQYVGSNWSINVAKRALGIGLDAGLVEDFVGTKAVTREEACLFAFNTLKATMVDYDTTITVGDVVIAGSKAQDVANTAKDETIKDDGKLQFAEKYFTKLTKKADTDDFMRPATTWTNNKKEIGTFVDYTLLVDEYTTAIQGKTLVDLLGKSTIEDNYVSYYVDGKANTTIKADNMVKTNSKDYATTGKGVLTQVFFDKDAEEITIVSVNTFLATATADYSEKKEELAVSIFADPAAQGEDNEVTLDEIAGIEDYKKDDMFLVNVAWDGRNYNIVEILDVEAQEDCKVTKYSSNSYMVTGGEQYDYARSGKLADSLNEIVAYGNKALTNYTYTLYIDQYGYLIGNEVFEGEDNYVFVTATKSTSSTLANDTVTANAIFLDGTMQTIKIDIKETNALITAADVVDGYPASINANNSELNLWFTYTEDDGVYTLEPVDNWMNVDYAAEGKINSYSVRLNKNSIGSAGTRAYGNDDSVYVTVEAGTVAGGTGKGITKILGTYTGVQDVDLTVLSSATNGLVGTSSVFAVYDDDLYIIGAIVMGEDTTSSKNYAYVLKDAKNEYIDDDDNYYWDFEAVVDGHIQTLTIKTTASKFAALRATIVAQLATIAPAAANGLMKLTYDKDGYVTGAVSVVDSDSKVYGNSDYGQDTDPDKFSVYTLAYTDPAPADFVVVGRTLYGHSTDAGLTLATGAPVVVVQTERYTGGEASKVTYTEYTTIDQALNSLKNKADFEGWVSAVLNNKGTAEYIVLNSADAVTVTTDGGASRNPVTNVTAVSATYTAGTISVSLTGPSATDVNEVVVSLVNGGSLVEITSAEITGTTGTIPATLGAGVYQIACGSQTYVLGIA